MKQPKIIRKVLQDKSIVLMESDKNYTVIHLSDGKRLMSGYNLKFYENCTDNDLFKRVNRSMMINKTFILRINLAESAIMLTDGRRVNISRRRMKELETWV